MPTPTKRINSIDLLRGMVMVVMALDHVRDFFSDSPFEPTDMQHASAVLFFTRWITHFCAPVFVFLSGTSAFLSAGKRSVREESWRLFTRGLWLIIMEVTIIRLGWTFNVDYRLVILQVIWAIGVSMIALSVFIFLPRALLLVIALAMIFGHNVLDGVQAHGAEGVVWQFLHIQGPVHYAHGDTIFIIYPLIPWIGVMAAGYCFGSLFKMESGVRDKWLLAIGVSAMVLFVALRFNNGYGDPLPWQPLGSLHRTLLSFLNCTKYPPSLLYLLMTLGPAITLMPLLERWSGKAAGVFIVYGRVPMFYYVLHIYLIHILSLAVPVVYKGVTMNGFFSHPGYSLLFVYFIWAMTVVILYLPCRWFMHIKKNHHKWWLSYL